MAKVDNKISGGRKLFHALKIDLPAFCSSLCLVTILSKKIDVHCGIDESLWPVLGCWLVSIWVLGSPTVFLNHSGSLE